jgi:hypothetical protein
MAHSSASSFGGPFGYMWWPDKYGPMFSYSTNTAFGYIRIMTDEHEIHINNNGQDYPVRSMLTSITNDIAGKQAAGSYVTNTPAGIAAAGGVITNSILGQGETDLGTGLTVTICNATASYYASPTGTWTLAMCASPLRYPRDLMIVSTNGSVIPSYITDLRTGSAGTTNLYYLRPSGTGTNWTLWGKSL